MTRLALIREAGTTREAAEILLSLICENRECNHNCAECTQDIEVYLEEELGEDKKESDC